MKRFPLQRHALWALLVPLLLCSCMKTLCNPTQVRKLSPTAPEFIIEGRVDRSAPDAPVIIWQATRIAIDFEGTQLALHFKDNVGQSYFAVEVDGQQQIIALKESGQSWKPWPLPLQPGRHELRIFKRSDAAAGHTVFAGIEIDKNARVFRPNPNRAPVSMLFFGDSITVGACNEESGADQWEDHSTTNNANSYGALTAAAFQADYRNIAISGMGVCEGYVDILAHQAWDALYPVADSVRAPGDGWQPDLVFVNLGENDSSHSHNQGHAFPADFSDKYVALLAQVRKDHPKARIVLLRGGMMGGAKNPALKTAWDKAVARIQTTDTNVSHFVFTHWSEPHPRVADDQAMAAELVTWLRAQTWMKDRSPAR